MTYFVSLKLVALVIGLIYLASHLPGALAPAWYSDYLKKLPRFYPLGVVLMGAATLWFVLLTFLMDLGEISNLRYDLMAVWLAGGILTIIFVPDFLAARGLGCLYLLSAAVILDSAFLVETPTRYVMTLLAYAWVIAGMFLVYHPFLLRDAILYITKTPERCRLFCWPGAVFGLVVIFLAIVFYP